jgi:hypothetical protein
MEDVKDRFDSNGVLINYKFALAASVNEPKIGRASRTE